MNRAIITAATAIASAILTSTPAARTPGRSDRCCRLTGPTERWQRLPRRVAVAGQRARHDDRAQRLAVVDVRTRRRSCRRGHPAREPGRQPDPPPHHVSPTRALKRIPTKSQPSDLDRRFARELYLLMPAGAAVLDCYADVPAKLAV